MSILTSSLRDLRDFLQAKRNKREPIFLTGRGVARASYRPSTRQQFEGFRELLRQNRDFAQASERIDSLERDLRKRGAALPLPNELVQNADRSITLHYAGLCVRAMPDFVATLVGGTSGHLERGVTPALLGALTIVWRNQCT